MKRLAGIWTGYDRFVVISTLLFSCVFVGWDVTEQDE